ncbi:thiamine-phosphate kinase [Thermococcus gammatolerans]|uniref:Thiamine-monophosphate kinase n=1 Tax=Thermococcus gammatolerans (strain DSM 15229 / JCM 11827 / EJ3) TaxID=593117 RepID=C5A3X6_THEGJ|nr:thiamine-phosphate kinase [Thermococcus gammatolerans]ACS32938.1 Thiamine monophosphate kinase (thiL) [Thermococcus gammatolerans EJ3]
MMESEIIELFIRHLKRQGDLPLGDDAGALRLGDRWLVATNDMLVRKTDVPDIMTPEQVGFKAVTMNVSDMASMGAEPLGFLFSLGIPGDLDSDYLEGIARGIGEALDFYGLPVLSADTNEADDLIIDGAALGITERLLTRSGAKPGELVCVTGDLGRALAGYLVWKNGLEVSDAVRKPLYEKFLEPRARVREGSELSKVASSAIDISDGLAKELYLLAEMSQVGIEVRPESLPLGKGVEEVAELLGLDPFEIALASGEEFELVFTVAPEFVESLNFDFSVIGRVTRGKGIYLVDDSGKRVMPKLGWEHLTGFQMKILYS